jgi:uncharacterized protein DUF6182
VILTQQRLSALAAHREQWVRPGGTAGVTALVLLRAVDVAGFVTGARAFAAALDAAEADVWRSSWTRTRFLFGNPVNLTGRPPARVIAPGGATAWLGPFPADRLPGLSRLLKPVTGVLPELPGELVLPPVAGPAGSPARRLHVATAGLSLAGYLIHLHHTVAEAVLMGRLRSDEPLRLIHQPSVDAAAARGTPSYARVHHEGTDEPLRLVTWLGGPENE